MRGVGLRQQVECVEHHIEAQELSTVELPLEVLEGVSVLALLSGSSHIASVHATVIVASPIPSSGG